MIIALFQTRLTVIETTTQPQAGTPSMAVKPSVPTPYRKQPRKRLRVSGQRHLPMALALFAFLLFNVYIAHTTSPDS
tara:strand:+ start:337 stop:567 length:231 start_codon:yes stop_codon:yes gene_type:complete